MPTGDEGSEKKIRGGGPKTPRGKSIARWNAMQHGATARKLFIPINGVHQPEYERYRQLADELLEELAPGAYLEDKILIQKFISDISVVERCDKLLHRVIPDGDGAVLCEAAPNSLRYVSLGQKNFLKSLKMIRELRARVEETEMEEARESENLSRDAEGENGENAESADAQGPSPESASTDGET